MLVQVREEHWMAFMRVLSVNAAAVAAAAGG
jgi:hypothetical protein